VPNSLLFFRELPKDKFPQLLKVLADHLFQNRQQNIISGFGKTGIHPINREKVLQCLPQQEADRALIGESFMVQLVKRRDEVTRKDAPKRKRKKLEVPAGKSITLE
jgi:hypothetical protein